MTTNQVLLDLGPGDVHMPQPLGVVAPPPPKAGGRRTLKPLTTEERNALPDSAFALPKERRYPIHDAAHAKNAMARLEQQKSRMSGTTYARARANILKAYKRFGINPPAESKKTSALIRTAGLSIHVQHRLAAEGATGVVGQKGAQEPTQLLRAVEVSSRTIGDVLGATEAAAGAAGGDASVPVWNQIAKLGQWAGHPSGPFQITRKDVADMVRNFRASQNRRVAIDFEHASEADPTKGSIPTEGAPAQGWIIDLQDRGADGLWGLVQWLEPARSYIREGKYRYFSPAIRFKSKERESGDDAGARLTSGALTNNPFLDGMMPMAAKDTGAGPAAQGSGGAKPGSTEWSTGPDGTLVTLTYAHTPDEYMPRMRAVLKLEPTATAAECMAVVKRLQEYFDIAGQMVCVCQGVDLGAYMPAMREMVAAPLGCTWEHVFEVFEQLLECLIGDQDDDYDEEAAPSSRGMRDTMTTVTTEKIEEITLRAGAAEAKLKDAEEKATALTARLQEAESTMTALRASEASTTAKATALEGKVAELTLQLNDKTGKLSTLETEIAGFREAEKTRLVAERGARVDATLATYGESRSLKPADRDTLLTLLTVDPAGYERMYPSVPPGQAHLLTNLNRQAGGTGSGSAGPGSLAPPEMTDGVQLAAPGDTAFALSQRLRKERGLDLADAAVLASRMILARDARARGGR